MTTSTAIANHALFRPLEDESGMSSSCAICVDLFAIHPIGSAAGASLTSDHERQSGSKTVAARPSKTRRKKGELVPTAQQLYHFDRFVNRTLPGVLKLKRQELGNMGCAVILAANLRQRSGKPKQLRVKVVGDRCITKHFLDDKCLRPELLGGAYQAVASTSKLEAARDQLEELPSLNIKKARAFVRELVIREVNVDAGYETDVPGSKFYQNVYSRWKDRRPSWWPFDDFSARSLNNCNKADLEALGKTLLKRRIDRLQATGADRQQQHVAACHSRRHPSEHRQEDEDSDHQVQDLSPEDVVDMVTDSGESDTNAAPSDDDIEEVVKAPAIKDAKQQFKSLAAFLADNTDNTAQDEVFFQRLINKAAQMGVIRLNRGSSKALHDLFPASES